MLIPEKTKNKLCALLYETNNCINYPKVNKDGYGEIQTTFAGKKLHILVHRAVYQVVFNDPLTSNDIICHKCDNPSCCNPKHLFKGTHLDNIRDKVNKNRQARGSKNGRYIDGRASDKIIKKIHSHGAKLRREQVLKIKELKSEGVKLLSIANTLHISYQTVKDISCGRVYKDI